MGKEMTNDGPAFPTKLDAHGRVKLLPIEPALTKREYFAGLAMQGMIAGLTKFKQHQIVDGTLYLEEPDLIIVNRPKDIAEISMTYADCLLAELAKESE